MKIKISYSLNLPVLMHTPSLSIYVCVEYIHLNNIYPFFLLHQNPHLTFLILFFFFFLQSSFTLGVFRTHLEELCLAKRSLVLALWLCACLRLALLFLRDHGCLLSNADGLILTLLRGKWCHHLTHEHSGRHHDSTTCHRTRHQLSKELRGCWKSGGMKEWRG